MISLTGSCLTDFASVLLALALVFVAFFKYKFTYWKHKGVHTLPTTIPYGNAKKIILQEDTIGHTLQKYYGYLRARDLPYGGFYLFHTPAFVPVDLDLIYTIMVKDFHHFTDHAVEDDDADIFSKHLIHLTGDKWKSLRAKLTPAFTSGKLKMMFPILVECAQQLRVVIDQSTEEHQPIKIKDVSARFTTDVIMSCAFGIEANCLKNPNAEFLQRGLQFFKPTWRQAFLGLLGIISPTLLRKLKMARTEKEVTDFFKNIVDSVVAYREKNNIVRSDFMHLLIQLKNNVNISQDDVGRVLNESKMADNGEGITMEELMSQAFVFWLAGMETSSTTTAFCMFELARHPEIQDNLRMEINDVLSKHSGASTYDALQEMSYLDQCINETLRKYTPLMFHARRCTEDYKVPDSDLVLEKGTTVLIPGHAIHSDEQLYPNPEVYDPERFTKENMSHRHPVAFTPFGTGPRICIGMRFGLMQTKMSLVTLLKDHQYSINSKTELPLQYAPTSIVLATVNDIYLNISKISVK